MSFSLVRPLFGFRPVIARSTCVDTAQFLRHRPLSAICRQPVHVPKTWVLDQLGIATGQRILPSLLTATGIAGIALGIATCTAPTIHCDNKDAQASVSAPYTPPPQAPPPESAVNLYELTFGTVTGICAGVFIKKGAKMVAFFFGGVFVLLQYLGSMSLVRVDWGRMGSRFENLLYTKDALGNKRAPTISSLWRWMVDFLTADFQPRASFIAGLALGLRVG